MTKEQAVHAMCNDTRIVVNESACSGEIEYECITGIMLRSTGQIVAELKSKSGNSVTFADIKNVKIKE